jgi:sporulation protein YunB
MGKIPYTYRYKKYKAKWNKMLIMLIILAIGYSIYIQLDKKLIPSAVAMAKMRATSAATHAINKGITKALAANQLTMKDLVTYDYNEEGELISWDINSITINNLSASITECSIQELENISMEPYKIPIGSLGNNRIFSNMGPKINIEIIPVGTVKVNYDNEICSVGINQVSHTVWLNVDVIIQFVVPLYSDQIAVSRKIVLIDKVIAGKIPESYVNVPKESILDVAP